MTHKKNESVFVFDQPLFTVREYMEKLGLKSVTEYKKWCNHHRLTAGVAGKTKRRLRDELIVASRMSAELKLRENKIEQNFRCGIRKIYDNGFRYTGSNRILETIANEFKAAKNPKLLLETYLYLEDNSKLPGEVIFAKGISKLVTYRDKWLRSLHSWKAQSHNSGKQFSSLVRYLLTFYEVPLFMDKVWFEDEEQPQKWFIHIGLGNNICTADNLPVSMTKKMAHYFLTAPADYSICAAFRWGQIHALGGDNYLAEAFRETRITDFFEDDSFWLEVIRFFIDYPMLDRTHVGPIVDFIWNQKYADRRMVVERGSLVNLGPAQPNFSMKGRTPESLLIQVERWHRQLAQEQKHCNLHWERSGFREMQFTEGSEKSDTIRHWMIRELLNSDELIAEGQAMKNCVASYAQSCCHGRCSIWTMELEDKYYRKKLLTIEVSPSHKLIRQARGPMNKSATPKEIEILQRWAGKEGLRLASYL